MASPTPPISAEVRASLFAWPEAGQAAALRLRDLIHNTAEETGAGAVAETLKWGQPSFSAGKRGTPLRLGYVAGDAYPVRLYVHCATNMIDQCRARFAELTYEKNRAICLSEAEPLPEDALKSCIALALTYHANKKAAHG